jgi:hypothetical protein
VAERSGTLEVVATQDLAMISAERLRGFEAVLFFTSGELDLSASQKSDLLAFVRAGKGFGGVHSASDTLYTWPEYGELIGGWFDGHPWTQEVRIDVEDPDHPATRHLAPSFSIVEEIYQHRNFSRERVRVLMTLDTSSVDGNAPGVNRGDGDFALAWVQPYGNGRVFYTALGHFDETWRDERFRTMMQNALLWLTGQEGGEAAPRPPAQPLIHADAVGNAASMRPAGTLSPGTLFSIYGENLTTGSSMPAAGPEGARKLAGAEVRINGRPVSLLYASPRQINAIAPEALEGGACTHPAGRCAQVDVVVPAMPAASALAGIAERTPGVFVVTLAGRVATIWATGLGAWRPAVTINGLPAQVSSSGPVAGRPGLYRVEAQLPPEVSADAALEVRFIE